MMGRVAGKKDKAMKERVAELPKEMKDKCGICNVALLTTVKDISQKTGVPFSTVATELSRVMGVPAQAMRDRVRNTYQGRRPSSSEKKPVAIVAQVRQDETPIVAQCHNTDMPIVAQVRQGEHSIVAQCHNREEEFPLPDEKPVASSSFPAQRIIADIEAQIKAENANRPSCFWHKFGATSGCQECKYKYPCQAIGDPSMGGSAGDCGSRTIAVEDNPPSIEDKPQAIPVFHDYDAADENEMRAMFGDDTNVKSADDFDLEAAVQGFADGVVGPIMSDVEIIQGLPRSAEWLELMDSLEITVAPGGKLFQRGLAPSSSACAFDLVALGARMNKTGAKAALSLEESAI